MSNGNSAEASTSPSPAPSSIGNNAPKFGTLVPNRVFVGGISGNTTEQDLLELFAKYGKVKATKVISDRAGVSKGYGFVTFETEEEARKLTQEADNIMLKDRKLNIAPAIKKQVNDLGYIKPYSPRLVDGTAAATVLGTNGTVFFGNGTTYAYTNPVPVLANPNEYHQAVTGVPTPTAAHPTFPPQVPQTGAHTAAVSAATQQVGGTPGTGYPAQFVYPQAMYFPHHQYPQFQTAALQPQWTASPQWRWVSPGAYAQPELSSLSSDSTSSSSSSQSGLQKGTPTSPSFPSATSSNPFAFPYQSSFPAATSTHHHSSVMPIVHPFIQNIQPQTTHSLATVSSCPVDVMASATSCTTVTTTTTTAVIGSNASLIRGNPKSCADAFGNGVLEISPLSQQKTYRGDVKITSSSNTEHEIVNMHSSSEDQKLKRIDSCIFSETASSTPRQSKMKRNSSKELEVKSSSESIYSSEESCTVKSCSQNCLSSDLQPVPTKTLDSKDESAVQDFSSSSPDIEKQTSSPESGTTTPSPPFSSHSKSSSIGEREGGAWPLGSSTVGPGLTSWCPQHSPHTIPFHAWSQASSTSGNCSPLRKLCGINSSHRESPRGKESFPKECPKISSGREDSLVGKPVLKMDGAAAALKSQYGPTSPQNPMMMVPWYQCSPTALSPHWFPWPPFLTLLPPTHCSFHPPAPNVHPPCFPPSPTIDNVKASPPLPRPTPPSPPHPKAQTYNGNFPPHQHSTGVKGRSPTWILNNGALTPSNKSEESCAVPFPRGPTPPHVTSSRYSPLKRGSLPFLGDSVKCLQRFTQLPDDRYALLPISPPLTPQQLDFGPHSPLNKH